MLRLFSHSATLAAGLRCRLLAACAAAALAYAAPADAAPAAVALTQVKRVAAPRSPEFMTPAGLRARVDFWKDVFSKYGRHFAVIHHRSYPQAVFRVLDFSADAAAMNPVQLDRYKDRQIQQAVDEVRAAIRRLAQGAPTSAFDQRVADIMRQVPGGPGKYVDAIKEDLIRSQTGIRERYAEAVKRSGRYLPLMEGIFREQGLPIELTRLPFVESSFDYLAHSSVGAAGIWQFMTRTGKLFMVVNKVVDERRDPIASSRAAARYLRDAYSQLGSWPLAVTSYNHGIGGVMRKVRENGTSNIVQLIENPGPRVFGFASSNFYPEFLAAVEIQDDYKRYFPEITLDAPLALTEYRLPQAMSVQHAAKQLGVSVDSLRDVNYALAPSVWDGRVKIPAAYALKVPRIAAARVANLRVPEPRVQEVAPPTSAVHGGILYTVRKGDSLAAISRRYNVSVGRLMELNGLSAVTVHAGQKLRVQKDPDVAEDAAPVHAAAKSAAPQPAKKPQPVKKSSSMVKPAKPLSAERYLVKKGESVWSISAKTGVSVERLKKLNGIKGKALKAGASIRLQ